MRNFTRAEKIIRWIEKFCVIPSGTGRGKYVCLTQDEKACIRKIYDGYNSVDAPITGPLACYLALFHVAGPEAGNDPPPLETPDSFTMWAATGDQLRAHLKRDGEAITCLELGTRFPKKA